MQPTTPLGPFLNQENEPAENRSLDEIRIQEAALQCLMASSHQDELGVFGFSTFPETTTGKTAGMRKFGAEAGPVSKKLCSLPLKVRSKMALQVPQRCGLTLDLDCLSDRKVCKEPIFSLLGPTLPQFLQNWIERVLTVARRDLDAEKEIVRAQDLGFQGVCGSYFIQDGTQCLAVVKPLNEEPGGLFSPRPDLALSKLGVNPGTSGHREVLAHRLVPDLIPPTVLMQLTSKKFIGEDLKECSVQQYVENGGSVESLKKQNLDQVVPFLEDMVFIDLWLANADRHKGNALLKGTQEQISGLVPIDHGCILPDNLSSEVIFFWYGLLASDRGFSAKTIERIKNIDLDSALETMDGLHLEAGAVNVLNLTTLFLKNYAHKMPMKELTMYYLATPESWGQSYAILRSILELSAFYCGAEISKEGFSFSPSSRKILEETLIEVVEFIEFQKSRALSQLLRKGVSDEILVVQNEEQKEKIHLVIQVVRKFLSEQVIKVDNTLNKTLKQQFIDALQTGSWKGEAERLIQEALASSIGEPILGAPPF